MKYGAQAEAPSEIVAGLIRYSLGVLNEATGTFGMAYAQSPVIELATAWKVGAHWPKVEGEVESRELRSRFRS